MVHPDPPLAAPERDTLVSFLDYQRAVIIDKVGGLTKEQLATPRAPSEMSLLGIVAHLAIVEDSWFSDVFAGNGMREPWASIDWKADRDWEWHNVEAFDPDEVVEMYREAIAASNRITADAASLDELSVETNRDGEHWSLRWILVHMIEETARHAGHADLFRESIDGETGDFRDEPPD
jgi:uncharacterized damage-inducible protein DinB